MRVFSFLLFAFSTAALADQVTLSTGMNKNTLNLDTGAIAGSGGDILFDGTKIVPQGNAKVANIGVRYDFASLSSDFVVQQAAAATSAPIAENLLAAFDVFVVVTNAGSTAKVWVIGGVQNFPVIGPNIGLQYTTFTGLAPGVTFVTGILNNSSLVAPGYPGYGIAPSSLFIVRGGSLADPGDPVLQSSAAPLPAFP
jgi:hypothetical protein